MPADGNELYQKRLYAGRVTSSGARGAVPQAENTKRSRYVAFVRAAGYERYIAPAAWLARRRKPESFVPAAEVGPIEAREDCPYVSFYWGVLP
jgi:hypothetical protein